MNEVPLSHAIYLGINEINRRGGSFEPNMAWRIFGIVGRALPFVAVGLAVFDVVSIGQCAYEARHGK